MSPIFRPGPGPYALAISMTGIKLGERLLQIGSGTPDMFATLATKVGVSGRAAAVDADEAGIEALEKAGVKAGVLVEAQQVPPGTLPFEDDAFDLVVLDRTRMPVHDAAQWLPDAFRVLRAGGRMIVAERLGGSAFRAVFGGASPSPGPPRAASAMLEGARFRPVRVIAERAGWRFTEGMKPRG